MHWSQSYMSSSIALLIWSTMFCFAHELLWWVAGVEEGGGEVSWVRHEAFPVV